MSRFGTKVQSNSLKHEIIIVTIVKDNNSLNNQIEIIKSNIMNWLKSNHCNLIV